MNVDVGSPWARRSSWPPRACTRCPRKNRRPRLNPRRRSLLRRRLQPPSKRKRSPSRAPCRSARALLPGAVKRRPARKPAAPDPAAPTSMPPGATPPGPPPELPRFETGIDFKPTPPGAKITFNLEDAELTDLVRLISSITGKAVHPAQQVAHA